MAPVMQHESVALSKERSTQHKVESTLGSLFLDRMSRCHAALSAEMSRSDPGTIPLRYCLNLLRSLFVEIVQFCSFRESRLSLSAFFCASELDGMVSLAK